MSKSKPRSTVKGAQNTVSTFIMTRQERRAKQVHHRVPRSRGGRDTPENTILVERRYHLAYHMLFQNMLPNEVARLLNDVYIDPDVALVAVPRPLLHQILRMLHDAS